MAGYALNDPHLREMLAESAARIAEDWPTPTEEQRASLSRLLTRPANSDTTSQQPHRRAA